MSPTQSGDSHNMKIKLERHRGWRSKQIAINSVQMANGETPNLALSQNQLERRQRSLSMEYRTAQKAPRSDDEI